MPAPRTPICVHQLEMSPFLPFRNVTSVDRFGRRAGRARYDRSALRYPSDLTDGEWAILAPLIPPAKRGGRPREVDIRAVIGGLLYVLETGCPWRHLPKDLPPKSTVHSYFELWAWDRTLAHIHDALYVAVREQEGREASPSAAVLDSQSAKSA